MMAGTKYYISIIKQIINQDKTTFNVKRKVKVNDGYGGFTEEDKEVQFSGRIYNRKSAREMADIHGISINFTTGEKILTLSEADIKKGDILKYQGRKLRVHFVNDYLGICKQSELEVIEDGN